MLIRLLDVLSFGLKLIEGLAIATVVVIGVDLVIHETRTAKKERVAKHRKAAQEKIRLDKEYVAKLYGGYFEESHVRYVGNTTGDLTYYQPKHAAKPELVWHYYKMMDRSADDLIFKNTEEL